MAWPDWRDSGKRVRLTLSDGKTVEGKLYVDDVFFNGEDEVPLFRVKRDDGSDVTFVDHESWEFVGR